jgi:hypothetical protein
MSEIWRIVPDAVGVVRRTSNGWSFVKDSPVTSIKAYPPFVKRSGPIRPEFMALEITTPDGTRWHGFADAKIGSDLRMHVKLAPGQERDEVVMAWEASDGPR